MDKKDPETIELSEREITRSYQLKPEARWTLPCFLVGSFLAAWYNGFENPATYALLFMGGGVVASAVIGWPHIHLKKIDD